jgi:hypothetical protein
MTKTTNQAAKTTKSAKSANIEGKFFGMIVLAWAVLAVLFNIAHSALPQAKSPIAGKAATASAAFNSTQAPQVASR